MDPVRRLFDELAEGERDRFDEDVPSRAWVEIHRRFLRPPPGCGWGPAPMV